MAFLYSVSGFVGLALLIVAAMFAFRRHRLWRDGVRATGHVVGHYESRSRTTFVEIPQDSGHRTFFPVIEFAGPGGNPVRFTASVGGSSPRFKLGAAVAVLYLRDRPAEASLGEFSAIWGMPMFAAGFAAFNLVVCILGFWMDDRVRPALTPWTSETESRAGNAGNGDSAGQR